MENWAAFSSAISMGVLSSLFFRLNSLEYVDSVARILTMSLSDYSQAMCKAVLPFELSAASRLENSSTSMLVMFA